MIWKRNVCLMGKKYDDLRLSPKEILIAELCSNVWAKSWKRFVVDWMYRRGLVMVRLSLLLSITIETCGCNHKSKTNTASLPVADTV